MMRVVFFGNSEGIFSNRHFAALKEVSCELRAVVDVPPNRRTTTSSRSASGHGFVAYAREQGIPVLEPTQPNSPDFVGTVRGLQPDLFLAVGYLNRFREDLLAVPRLLTANFHASLLPAYRGLHPVFRALRAGEQWAGLTVHDVDSRLDTGDILYQVRVRTRREDSVDSLYDRIIDRSVGLVGRLVTDAETGRLSRRPQGAAGASYFSSVGEEEFRLDWQRDAEQLRRWICATPGRCFCYAAGERVYLGDAELVEVASDAPAGTLVGIGRSRCTIATGSGPLSVGWIRVEDENLPAAVWCRKRGLKAGVQLGDDGATHFIS